MGEGFVHDRSSRSSTESSSTRQLAMMRRVRLSRSRMVSAAIRRGLPRAGRRCRRTAEGEQTPKVAAGIPQPPRLGDESEQGLHHREGGQLGVGDPREYPDRRPSWRPFRTGFQQVIGTDLECGGEGVQVCVHKGLPARRWDR